MPAPFIGAGQTTVGTAIRVEHRRATVVGDSVEILAAAPMRPKEAASQLTFTVQAVDIHTPGTVVAAGKIDRAIVERNRFLA